MAGTSNGPRRFRKGLAYVAAGLPLMVLAGCGGGHSTPFNPPNDPLRSSMLARFDVDVVTGKVQISEVEDTRAGKTQGRALFNGSAVSFSSSDLSSVPGDSGQRILSLSVTNNTRQTLPYPLRVIIGNLANTTTSSSDYAANTVVSTLAGSGTPAITDGDGLGASFASPRGVVAGRGATANMFFASDGNSIRKILPNGTVTTFAGAASSGFADGSGTNARFNSPQQIAVDAAGNLFVVETVNRQVRRITPQGVVSTIAGGSGSGPNPAGNTEGRADQVSFAHPFGIAVSDDGRRIFVSDYQNHNIKRILRGLTLPADLATSYDVITMAGSNSYPGIAGDVDAASTDARFDHPANLALLTDSTGTETLFIADRFNNKIRRFDNPASYGTVTSIAGIAGVNSNVDGSGTVATFKSLYGLAVTPLSGGGFVLFATDCTVPGSNLIRMVRFTAGADPLARTSYNVYTVAGGSSSGYQDGTGTTARFNGATGVTAIPVGTSANLLIADTSNYRVRKAAVPTSLHSAGGGSGVTEAVRLVNWDSERPNANPAAWTKNVTPTGNGTSYSTNVQFYVPNGVSGFSFTAYVEADTDVVNLPGAGNSSVSTVAGDGTSGNVNGPGKLAEFNTPTSIAAVPPSLRALYAFPARAFVVDSVNNQVRAIDTSGNITTFATGFNAPTGIVIAPDGGLFVTDTGNNVIKRISPNGSITTIGNGTMGNSNGAPNQVQFFSPRGIAIDSGGNVYVTENNADTSHWDVRKITLIGNPSDPNSYTTSTPVGQTSVFLSAIAVDTDGRAYITRGTSILIYPRAANGMFGPPANYTIGLTGPKGIAFDTAHNLYITDGSMIKRVSPGGSPVTTIAGSTAGFVDGSAGTFNTPIGIAIEASGTVLVTDTTSHSVRAVQRVLSDAQP